MISYPIPSTVYTKYKQKKNIIVILGRSLPLLPAPHTLVGLVGLSGVGHQHHRAPSLP